MSTKSSQIVHSPSETLLSNNASQTNVNQLLSVEIITTSQPSVAIAAQNMIPSQPPLILRTQENVHLTRRQVARRRRRQRQRQRRREHQEQQRQQQPTHQRERRESSYQEWQRRLENREYQRRRRAHDRWNHSDSMEDWMDPINNSPLIAAYEWETMDPVERWNQEQINEFEGFAALEQIALVQDDIAQLQQINDVQEILESEKQATNEQIQAQLGQYEQSIEDENRHHQTRLEQHAAFIEGVNEQSRQIDEVQQIQHENQQERNEEELIQVQQYENVVFLIQQMNQHGT